MRKGFVLTVLICFAFVSCQKKKPFVSPPVPEAIQELGIPQEEVKKEKLKKDLTAFKFEPYFVEILETNTDDISEIIVSPDSVLDIASYTVDKETLILNKKGYDYFQNLDEQDFLEAKLIVSHEILYDGKMRNTSKRKYYVFYEMPASVTFQKSFHNKILLSGRTSSSQIFDQRVLPEKIEFHEQGSSLRIVVGATQTPVYAGREKVIFEGEKRASVLHQGLAPIPLGGEVKPEDIRLTEKDFGEKTFQTKLHLKFLGKLKNIEIQE